MCVDCWRQMWGMSPGVVEMHPEAPARIVPGVLDRTAPGVPVLEARARTVPVVRGHTGLGDIGPGDTALVGTALVGTALVGTAVRACSLLEVEEHQAGRTASSVALAAVAASAGVG
jgi:hypothetical protein